jgi:hypothetical protein
MLCKNLTELFFVIYKYKINIEMLLTHRMPDINIGGFGPANTYTEDCYCTHLCYALLYCMSAVSF